MSERDPELATRIEEIAGWATGRDAQAIVRDKIRDLFAWDRERRAGINLVGSRLPAGELVDTPPEPAPQREA